MFFFYNILFSCIPPTMAQLLPVRSLGIKLDFSKVILRALYVERGRENANLFGSKGIFPYIRAVKLIQLPFVYVLRQSLKVTRIFF